MQAQSKHRQFRSGYATVANVLRCNYGPLYRHREARTQAREVDPLPESTRFGQVQQALSTPLSVAVQLFPETSVLFPLQHDHQKGSQPALFGQPSPDHHTYIAIYLAFRLAPSLDGVRRCQVVVCSCCMVTVIAERERHALSSQNWLITCATKQGGKVQDSIKLRASKVKLTTAILSGRQAVAMCDPHAIPVSSIDQWGRQAAKPIKPGIATQPL